MTTAEESASPPMSKEEKLRGYRKLVRELVEGR